MRPKKTKVDPFRRKAGGNSPELVDDLKIEKDELVERVFEIYHNLNFSASWFKQATSISQLDLKVLNPAQIDVVLREILDDELRRSNEVTGRFLSRLIQDSYNAGYNNFVLTTGDTAIEYLCYKLEGASNRELEVRVNGSAGINCGFNSKHISVTVQGNVGVDSGSHSYSSTFAIEGNAASWCGAHSYSSTFSIEGNMGVGLGYESNFSSFTVEGSIEGNCGEKSKGGKYFTPNYATYKKMKKMIPKGNEMTYQEKPFVK